MNRIRIFYSDSNEKNIIGLIHCYENSDDIEYKVYMKSDNGLNRLDLNGNHSYKPSTTDEAIIRYIDSYTREYFENCHFKDIVMK